jgi:4'-phosphopantetheinyl transferase
LGRHAVHIWRVRLDQPGPIVAACEAHLSSDERGRTDRFHFARDRRRFVVARAALRDVLGRYLALPPVQVAFTYGPQGKPALDAAIHTAPLQFNLSHCDELALIAVTARRSIGVDLERVREIEDLLVMAERTFSRHETAALLALPEAQRPEAFLNCWTRKEAFVKALGDGLSWPLDQFDVSLAPDEPARLLAVAGDPAAVGRWRLCALAPADGYVGALAVEGDDWRLSFHELEP